MRVPSSFWVVSVRAPLRRNMWGSIVVKGKGSTTRGLYDSASPKCDVNWEK